MKKFIIVLAILFTVSVACKKEGIDGGGGLCACTVVSNVGLALVIKNDANQDLLNVSTANSFPASQIQLYKKESDGSIKPIAFIIRPPFNYSNDSKFEYFTIFSWEISTLTSSINDVYYLKLGNLEPYTINLGLNAARKTERVLINGKDIQRDMLLPSEFPVSIFYFTKH